MKFLILTQNVFADCITQEQAKIAATQYIESNYVDSANDDGALFKELVSELSFNKKQNLFMSERDYSTGNSFCFYELEVSCSGVVDATANCDSKEYND